MATIENCTGVPHFWFEQTGAEGDPLDVLVVRGTFAFAANGQPMTLAVDQQPIAFGDEYSDSAESDPLRAVITADGDLLPYKPGTDVVITGHAIAPAGIAQSSWLASVAVGKVHKTLRIHGPRQFYKRLFGWRLEVGEPVVRVALDYRLAYGGCIDVPAALTGDGVADTVKHASNPAGCGWLPKPAAYRDLPSSARKHVDEWIKRQKFFPAPQIELSDEPIRHPFQDVRTQGFGPVPRWCEPRLSWQGTYDNQWQATRYPMFPMDFDPRYYQCADADLTCYPHLVGDEVVLLTGLLSDDRAMQLPSWRIVSVVTRASGESTVIFLNLDTVRLDLDSGLASLVWRAHFDCYDPVVEVAVAATTDVIESESAATTTKLPGESSR